MTAVTDEVLTFDEAMAEFAEWFYQEKLPEVVR